MKLSTLLNHRDHLLRQARLANLAFAYQTLARFAERVARAQLRGVVVLKSAAPDLERFCATLAPLEGSPAVLEEHFTDEDVLDLADVIAFITGNTFAEETFRLEEAAEKFLVPLRAELETEGVSFDQRTQQVV